MNLGFQRCVNDWCYQHGTNEQYTKCKNASEDGRTCYNPTVRYGTAIGGRPGYERGITFNDASLKTWCHQLFPEYNILSGSASRGSRETYKGWLLWCNYGDEQYPHWCNCCRSIVKPRNDWMRWKDCQSCLDTHNGLTPNGVGYVGMKSVTCNFP